MRLILPASSIPSPSTRYGDPLQPQSDFLLVVANQALHWPPPTPPTPCCCQMTCDQALCEEHSTSGEAWLGRAEAQKGLSPMRPGRQGLREEEK